MAEPRFVATPRDVDIVQDVLESGALGIGHVARLYFGSLSRARRRMARLEAAGIVRRIWVSNGSASASSAFAAAPGAADLLALNGRADRNAMLARCRRPVSRLHLLHSLGVASVRTALTGPGAEYLREPEVFHRYRVVLDGRPAERAFRPDGCFLADRAALFVEYDTGSAGLRKFAEGNCRSYADYRHHGLFRSEYGERRPAMLVVTSAGAARASRLAAAARRESGVTVYAAELWRVEASGRAGACFRADGGEAVSFEEILAGGGA